MILKMFEVCVLLLEPLCSKVNYLCFTLVSSQLPLAAPNIYYN